MYYYPVPLSIQKQDNVIDENLYPATVLNSNDQHISEVTIPDESEKRGGIIYYSQEQDESITKIVGKYTLFVSRYVVISLF